MKRDSKVVHDLAWWLVSAVGVAAAVLFSVGSELSAAEPPLPLKKGAHITYIGNTMADRMQHSAWLETYIHA
ncbi:MAG: hypothetical protein RIS70_2939, partial [Planctomycetota bacterium]